MRATRRLQSTLRRPFNALVYEGSQRRQEATRNGRLAGWRVAVKDNIAVEGWPLTCASASLASFVSPYSAEVVRMVLAAGAELVGKTNMDEFGMGSRGERSIFGATRNPRDERRSAGGSSSGSAAAVAGGLARMYARV